MARRRRAVARGKRAQIEHPWPDVGAVLEADYFGTHYTAEVIEAPVSRRCFGSCPFPPSPLDPPFCCSSPLLTEQGPSLSHPSPFASHGSSREPAMVQSVTGCGAR